MLDFKVNIEGCTQCGSCVDDCPARIISMEAGVPAITAENEPFCYHCQHCFAVCPTGAISILGHIPEESLPLTGDLPNPVHMETLMKGRRAVRRYRKENLEPELLRKMLDVACHAPSARNIRQVRFTVVDDHGKLMKLRDDMMAGLCRLVQAGTLPKGLDLYLVKLIKWWEEEKIDFLFCDAPHLLVASAPREVVCPEQDCIIALSYFEIYAQSQGVGTVWDGLAKLTINDLLPEFRERLGIPPDHVIGYAMAFGRPAVTYARTTQHGPPQVHIVS